MNNKVCGCSKALANVLLTVNVAIHDVETEIDELSNTDPLNDELFEQLNHDRITLINISYFNSSY